MKKLLALLLAFTMVLSLGAVAYAADDDAYEVEVLLPIMQTAPSNEAIQEVEDAINDYILNTLGISDIKMDLKMQTIFDYANAISMDLASGAKHDIILTLGLNTFVSNGYLVDLTDMVDDELAGAVSVLPDKWLRCGTVDGKVYAIPCYKGQVLSWKYIYDADIYGDVVDWSTIHDIDDLDAVMPDLKAAAPDERPYVFMMDTVQLDYFQDHVSPVGTYLATEGESTELVNLFATDAFKEGCERAYRWSQAGYTDPEGSTNTLTHDVLISTGASKGVMMGHAYSIETIDQMFSMNNDRGATFKSVEIGVSDMTNNELVYGIAYTSGNPSAAARMMSLIWTDEFIMSAIIYGLEGVSYEWNEDHTSIVYPEGLGMDTVPYSALFSCGVFGNQFNLYGMDGNTSESDKGFMEDLINEAWVPPLFGFIPDATPVATQVAAVSNVYDQYYNVLVYGDVNPDEFLPQFLSALEAAGINDIIAEYQAQADAWLETID